MLKDHRLLAEGSIFDFNIHVAEPFTKDLSWQTTFLWRWGGLAVISDWCIILIVHNFLQAGPCVYSSVSYVADK